jgi:hypothetical protein
MITKGSKMKNLTAVAALAAVLVAASIVAPALASRKPTHKEAVAITKAFKTTSKAGLNQIAYEFNVVKIRVSTVNSHYARANFVAQKRYRNVFQPSYGVAKHGTHGWKALDVGSASVGCGKVPAAVRKDLKLLCAG